MARKINAGLAEACLAAGALPYLQAAGSKDGAGLLRLIGVCAGFAVRKRLLVMAAAVPIIGVSVLFSLI